MARSFGEAELVFSAAYAQIPTRTIRIQNGTIRSLDGDEVEPSAGCFDFGEISAYKDRFLIWRANGSNLTIEERSVETDLLNGTCLLINLIRSHIIPGTVFTFSNGKLVFIVPTQTTIHRFFIQMPTDDPSGLKKSFISELHDNTSVSLFHDKYELTTQGCIQRAGILHSSSNGTTIGCFMNDGRFVLVQMHHVLGAVSDVTENVLKSDSFLHRMIKSESSDSRVIASLTPFMGSTGGGQMLFYVLYKDADLHVYSTTAKVFSVNLPNQFNWDTSVSGASVIATALKIFDCVGRIYVATQLQGDRNSGILLGYIRPSKPGDYSGLLMPLRTLALPNVDVMDFSMIDSEDEIKLLALCRTADGRHCLMTASLDSSIGDATLRKDWEEISVPQAFNAEIDCFMAQRLGPCAMKRYRIFNADNFSFDVVVRSLQLVCKHEGNESIFSTVQRNDWKGLGEALDQYLNSPQFDQHHMSRAERSSIMGGGRSNEEASKRFWVTLQNNAQQLNEAACRPMAIWHSKSLALYGTIQQGRLTICRNCDEQMEWLRTLIEGRCQSGILDLDALELCMGVAMKFAANEMVPDSLSVEDVQEFSRHFQEISRFIEDVISKFAEMTPVDFSTHLVNAHVPYGGSFTAGLLAASLRRQIDDRLIFSHRLIAFVAVARAICNTNEFLLKRDARWDMTLNIHERTLHNVNRQYTVLSQAAAIRIANCIDNEMSLAEAFFTGTGLTAIEGYAHAKIYLDDDMEEEGEADEDDDEGLEEEGNRSKRGDRLVDGNLDATSRRRQNLGNDIGVVMDGEQENLGSTRMTMGRNRAEGQHTEMATRRNYSQFIGRLISTAQIALWPESPALLLPKFLASGHHYSALLEYCQLNEPYIKELLNAFRFFEGIAYSGLSQPDKALHSFLDALEGMEQQDEALRGVLYALGDTTSKNPSITEFFLNVMTIMESYNYGEQLVQLGRLALRKCVPDDPLLATVYTTIFKHELHTGRYKDSLRTLLSNPSVENQKICLRELLAKLIDADQRKVLVSLDYGNMEYQVINILEGRARAADISEDSSLYDLLFAFYFKQKNFVKAALSMYELANRLCEEVQNGEILLRRCRCLSVVGETLNLLPKDLRFLTIFAPQDNGSSRMDVWNGADDLDEEISSGSGHLPSTEESSAEGNNKAVRLTVSRPLIIRSIDEILKDSILCDCRYALLQVSTPLDAKSAMKTSIPPAKSEEVLNRLIEKKLFDRAWLLCSAFSLPPHKIISAVTLECIKMDASPDTAESQWMTINRNYTNHQLSGSKERHWCIMRSYVEMAVRSYPHDNEVLRSAATTFLQYDWPLPCWLLALYEEKNVNDLLNLLISYGHLETACRILMKVVETTNEALISAHSRCTLPYHQIDIFFNLVGKSADNTLKELSKELVKRIGIYFDRIETFSRN